MKKLEIANGLTRKISMAGLKIKKYSPEILVVAGVTGTVASAVMACKATTKAGAIIEEKNKQMDAVQQVIEMNDPEYTEEDKKKDTVIIYAQTGVKFAKLYGPAVLLGAVSLTCILASNNILRKRNLALAAAYATIDKGFKEYRGRVVERFGKELDNELLFNTKAKEFEKTVTDEKGKEKVEKEIVSVSDPNIYSTYARVYDDGCTGWCKDPELNLSFLNMQQKFATDKLKSQGYLFLSDVYAMLGLPKSKAGQVVGWIYDEVHPIGDNFVDFGIYNLDIEKCRDFVNGYEKSIVLDFNVDGNILDLI